MRLLLDRDDSHGYHPGEIRAQERAGEREIARRRERLLQETIPEVAHRFLAERRMVILGTLDPEQRPWASVLTGARGFARALDDRTVRIAAGPAPDTPLASAVDPGGLVGMIAIDLERRMRLRVNGRLSRDPEGGLLIHTHQVYANCPKYIQARELLEGPDVQAAAAPIRSRELDPRHRDWIRQADTFFIVTANPGEGVDASHRGGMPGFIHVEGNRLTWPDYVGNAMYSTLGNIEVHPQAGLVFLDFETGSTLHVTGRAGVDWSSEDAAAVPGALRLVHVDVDEILETPGVLPGRFGPPEYSPFNPS